MKHLEVAHTVVDFLHKSFPDAPIALGGSVAEFFFRKDSDLDILFMKASTLNTEADDFGMTFEGLHNQGFFCSNRKDGRARAAASPACRALKAAASSRAVSGRGKQPLSRWSARNRNFVAKNCSKVSSTRYPSRYIVVRLYEPGRG